MNAFEREAVKNGLKDIQGIEVVNIFQAEYSLSPIFENYIVFYTCKKKLFCSILDITHKKENEMLPSRIAAIKGAIEDEAAHTNGKLLSHKIPKGDPSVLATHLINTFTILEVLGMHEIGEYEYRKWISNMTEELLRKGLDPLSIRNATFEKFGIDMDEGGKTARQAKTLERDLVLL